MLTSSGSTPPRVEQIDSQQKLVCCQWSVSSENTAAKNTGHLFPGLGLEKFHPQSVYVLLSVTRMLTRDFSHMDIMHHHFLYDRPVFKGLHDWGGGLGEAIKAQTVHSSHQSLPHRSTVDLEVSGCFCKDLPKL